MKFPRPVESECVAPVHIKARVYERVNGSQGGGSEKEDMVQFAWKNMRDGMT